VQFSIRVPAILTERLDAMSRYLGHPRSEVVRLAICFADAMVTAAWCETPEAEQLGDELPRIRREALDDLARWHRLLFANRNASPLSNN
jgi:hypothetical protein